MFVATQADFILRPSHNHSDLVAAANGGLETARLHVAANLLCALAFLGSNGQCEAGRCHEPYKGMVIVIAQPMQQAWLVSLTMQHPASPGVHTVIVIVRHMD